MGVAGCIANVLQSCGPAPVPDPTGATPCPFVHPDPDPSIWVAAPFPADWVPPFTIDWGDGTVEAGSDGDDAHGYAPGAYTVRASDSAGHVCTVAVTVPHG